MKPSGTQVSRQSPEEALSGLGSGLAGLSLPEVARRQEEFGPNTVEVAVKSPWWANLLSEFTHFFAVILWIATLLALIAHYLEPDQGMLTLALAIVGVIIVNGSFAHWQAYRAEQALAALFKLLPSNVKVRRAGQQSDVPASELVPGDLIILVEGDRVPADCRILESWGMRVDLSTLTGEPHPKARDSRAETTDLPDPLAAHDLLLAGTQIVSGECTAVVFATGLDTEFGQIAHLTQRTASVASPLQTEIRHVSRLLATIAVGLGLLFFFLGQFIGLPFLVNLMFAIGVIVANVPEGLLPTVTLSLAMATQRMAKRNALVRHLPAVETMGCATVILTDKTGTLTQNRMRVREWFSDGHHLAAERWPVAPASQLCEVARHCHSLKFLSGLPRGDPMEIALWEFAGSPSSTWSPSGELPFDADRRRMSVWGHSQGDEAVFYCKGAPESLFPLCERWIEGQEVRVFDAATRARFEQAQADMAARGLRVLACAWKPLAPAAAASEDQLILCGLVGLEDPPRPDVRAAIQRCHEASLRVIMVTGDYPITALAIAREIDLVRGTTPRIITGDEVRKMSAAALQIALDTPEIIFARVSAGQKMLIVQALQRKGEVVAATGDGVNDAPALRMADIGIAMGRSGTDVAREAADIVLLDDHFGTIVNAIEEGRAVYENIRKFITYILTSNIPELVPYLAFVLCQIPLPLTILQILAVDLGTDMLPAIALGAERPSEDVMHKPPRSRKTRLLSPALLTRAYFFLGPLQALGAMVTFFFMLGMIGWQPGQSLAPSDPGYQAATSACLMAIVLAQMVNLFVCRHPELPAWRCSPFTNRWLCAGLTSEALILWFILYTDTGNRIFSTAPLPLDAFLVALPFALLLGLAEELRKGLVRHFWHGKTGIS